MPFFHLLLAQSEAAQDASWELLSAPTFFFTLIGVCLMMIVAGAMLDRMTERERKRAKDSSDEDAEQTEGLSKAERRKAKQEAKARKKKEKLEKKKAKTAGKQEKKKGKKKKGKASDDEPAEVAVPVAGEQVTGDETEQLAAETEKPAAETEEPAGETEEPAGDQAAADESPEEGLPDFTPDNPPEEELPDFKLE